MEAEPFQQTDGVGRFGALDNIFAQPSSAFLFSSN
jgi:hypothetical protein